jgi:multiple sugar transport system substrate-binding protein
MRRTIPHRAGSWRAPALAGLVGLTLVALSACDGGGSTTSDKTTDVTITVALAAADAPPKAALAQFTKQTGITVKWVNLDWDSLQTKISAAATAKTYFADATDVDWSRVGELGTLGWFYPMDQYVDTNAMKADVPQLASFTYKGHVVGVPYDGSFMVTTVNTALLKKAGVTATPTTMDAYTAALRKVKSSGAAKYPLNIPFAAGEGLSTYWYETTHAFGGTILDGKGHPQFTDPSSPGSKAAPWMVDAVKGGLVPPGNINVLDSQGEQTLMARAVVASTFSDYSGLVGTLYNVPSSSSVVNKVRYLSTPGVTGTVQNLSNPDGIGIPKTAKYPKAAAKFVEWFTGAELQAQFAGLQGPDKAWASYALPSHLSAVQQLATGGKLIGGDQLATLLKASKPVFPEGAPKWYPKFSNAVYTHLHAAAAGSETVAEAVKAIGKAASELAAGS